MTGSSSGIARTGQCGGWVHRPCEGAGTSGSEATARNREGKYLATVAAVVCNSSGGAGNVGNIAALIGSSDGTAEGRCLGIDTCWQGCRVTAEVNGIIAVGKHGSRCYLPIENSGTSAECTAARCICSISKCLTAVATVHRYSANIAVYGYRSALVGGCNIWVAARQVHRVAAKVDNAIPTGAIKRWRRYNSPGKSSGTGNRLPASRCLEGENLGAVASIFNN